MLVGLDHVVLASADPDATAADLQDRLGLAATGGGRHDAYGTFNRLIWLGDAYLELIGVFDEQKAQASWLGAPVVAAIARGGGLVTWAVAVADLEAALRWGPPEGGLEGPFDGERRRPDGETARWRLARPHDVAPAAPFLIEHDETAAEWTTADRAARADARHPFGGRVRLAGLEVVVTSPPVAAGRLRTLLGVSAEPAGRRAVRIWLSAQEVRLVLDRPGPRAVVELISDLPGRARVAHLGDCDVRLRGLPIANPPSTAADGR
jgi:Glyoxalase-like domain